MQRVGATERRFRVWRVWAVCLPGEQQTDTAATFDEARAAFQAAREILLPKKTEADFEEWRAQQKWTAEKYALWERGKRSTLISQVYSDR